MPGRTKTPRLGLCLGLQVMVIEFSCNEAGLERANSREFCPSEPYLVIDLMDDQRESVSQSKYGGTMRLGTYPAKLRAGSQMTAITGPSWFWNGTVIATR